MESNFVTQILLPVALFIIMMGMGLTLVPADFKRIFLFPKAVATGLILKLLFIPALTFALLAVIPMSPELAVGFILLAACPGGATTNLITHLAKGDVALSITLTAIASVITVFSIPVFVEIGLLKYLGETQAIELPFFRTIVQILVITVLPVCVGMVIFNRFPKAAAALERPVKLLSAVFLILIILGVLVQERANLGDFFAQAGPFSLLLNIAGMGLGYAITWFITRNRAQAVTVGIEIGVVNGTLGIAIAAGILQNSVMTIPSAIYSIIMFPTVMLMIYIGTRGAKLSAKADAASTGEGQS